jgi:hypothetical protein
MNTQDLTIDAAMRADVINGTISNLDAHYVFPAIAQEVVTAIRQRQDNGEYDDLATATALRDVLTAHMQEVSRDKHLQVRYHAEPQPFGVDRNMFDDPQFLERLHQNMRRDNFGFARCERQRGNIGYLDLRSFAPPEWDDCGQVAAAAMTFLVHTSALIIDVRRNGGGAAGMVDLLCSYLLPATPERPVHLYDFYARDGDRLEQHWTLPHVPGRRYLSKPVYVLTSGRTVSAAESFADTLQTMRRATLVGELTAGAGNPVGLYRINAHFSIFVSNGRAINAVTGGNWEGVGVTPDILVPQEDALRTAHIAALRKLRETPSTDPDRELQEEMRVMLGELEHDRPEEGSPAS